LKHPRSEEKRAVFSGVNHKFCSAEHLQCAVHIRKVQKQRMDEKVVSLKATNEKLLHDSWHQHPTAKPFVKTFLSLIENNKLSEFDLNFISTWLGKKDKGRYYRADEQAKRLVILFSNKLGEKMYSTTAPLLGLPTVRQARRIRAKDIKSSQHVYFPGINRWPLEKMSRRQLKPLQNGMDGTRIIRALDLYLGQYIVGRQYPPDVRLFAEQLSIVPGNLSDLNDYVVETRQKGAYASEAYSFNFSDTTGEYCDVLVGTIPESTSGVTGNHIVALMLQIEKDAFEFQLPLIGHCTDSAANSLSGLIKLASPSTYSVVCDLTFIGLPSENYVFFSPFIRPDYPSIAYPCWDHSARTVLRNLMNDKITLVCGVLPDSKDCIKKYMIASIKDLLKLKRTVPNCGFRHSDITPHIKQNCDATSRVLTNQTIQHLASIPGSSATQLFLIAAVSTHEPYRNKKFGPPPEVAKTLWKGLSIWRRWRDYVCVMPELKLSLNFVSSAHYMTEELLVHAGINHLLTLYLLFPQLPIEEYSLRNTGNRGLEAFHSIFRGGTATLPITSANLSFQEFLMLMNKVGQIREAEQELQKIDGNPVVASKKKRKTGARDSNDVPSKLYETYKKPDTYAKFLVEIGQACAKGEEEAKQIISVLAPDMKKQLKEMNRWENPHLAIATRHSNLNIIKNNIEEIKVHFELKHDEIIDALLGCVADTTLAPSSDTEMLPDTESAYANFITDICTVNDESLSEKNIRSILKGLQPYRERPSKDRSKRFAAGEIPFDQTPPSEHNVKNYSYWCVKPLTSSLRSACLFLLAQYHKMESLWRVPF